MINDEAKNSYYLAGEKLLELYSSEWLRCKKAATINGNNDFKNALNEALNYQKSSKISLTKKKKYVTYVMKSFVRMNMMKIIKAEEKLKITAITLGNLEKLPIAFGI